ncbi:MAG: isopentenyl-diphosphate delta-isomerase, partial [Verrucomicrobia bacterium]|nr:isopentenyl-diphosphate delta-isomerase [Verrucomicrobiota bacterium]
GEPNPNPEEIEDSIWVSTEQLLADMKAHKERYTYWFTVAMERVVQSL